MYEIEREVAAQVVAEASGLTRLVQDGIVAAGESLTKGDRSPVTLADLAVQVVVSRRLAERFPDDPLLAEEDSAALAEEPEMAKRVLGLAAGPLPELTADGMIEALDRGGYEGTAAGRYWVLDPIDGTKGFLRGDQYAIALALVDGGRPVVGTLGCPNLPVLQFGDAGDRGCLFTAVRGGGSTGKPLDSGAEQPIQVDDIVDPAKAVVCESVVAAHAAHSVQARIAARLGITASPYRTDSQCKYAVLARGEASIYLRLPRDASYREKVWDHAAGVVVIEEAGGKVTDLEGAPLDFSQGRLLGNHRGIVATNGAIHEQVLEACRIELGLD
ncbi:MAG: 3'(2'),5'-bisphosphate nucleotidase, partial [Thermoanaerobaculales bacterium]